MEQVTKAPPHPGRQAAGKRLVEWNRKKKEELLKNQKDPSVQKLAEPSTQDLIEPSKQNIIEPSKQNFQVSNLGYQLLPSLAVLAIVGGLYMYTKKSAEPPKSEPPPEAPKQRKKYM